MKKNLLLAILCIIVFTATAQVEFDALKITPQFPKAGQTVSFKFNAALSPFIDDKKVEVVIYLFAKDQYKVLEPAVLQRGKNYSGSFKTEDSTACIAFSFESDKQKDNNAGKGFIVPVYNTDNTPVKEFYKSANELSSFYLEELLGIPRDVDKGLGYLEEGITRFPELKTDGNYFNYYANAIKYSKREDASTFLLKEIQQFELKANLTETDYQTIIGCYNLIKAKDKSDSITMVMKNNFPDGYWKRQILMDSITRGNGNATTKQTLYENYIKTYPPKKEDESLINYFKNIIALAYHKENNDAQFEYWASLLPKETKVNMYNNFAWDLALAKKDLDKAKNWGKAATEWAKKEMTEPSEKKSETLTKKQWFEQRKGNYVQFADTYAFVLYQTGDYKEGLPYAKDAASLFEKHNADYNERYIQLLEKTAQAETVKKEIEQMVKDGAASIATKAILKTIFLKEKKTEAGYDAYLNQLELAAKIKHKEEVAKSMITEAAPKFALAGCRRKHR